MKFLEFTKENDYVCTAFKINSYIPQYYFDSSMAQELGEVIQTFGVFNIEVFMTESGEPELYSIDLPIDVKLAFTESSKCTRNFNNTKDEEYRVFTCYKHAVFIHNALHIENSQGTVHFLNFLLNGKLPESIKYSDLPKTMKDNAKMNGINLGVPSSIVEVVMSEMSRDRKDPTIPFRKIAGKTGAETGYESARIREIPSMSSTWAGLGFEDINTAILSGLVAKREGRKQQVSPTEELLYY